MISLTQKGQQIVGASALAIVLLAGVFVAGRCIGELAAKTAADVALEQQAAAATKAAAFLADSLERITRAVVKLAARAEVPHARAIARTDTAAIVERVAREAAERLARDSAATLEQLRAATLALARADSIAEARVLAERDAANNRIALKDSAIAVAMRTIDEKNQVIRLAADDKSALQHIIADLKHERPGFFHRAVKGVATVAIAGGCGALGSLASPLAAIAAGGACAAAAGAWLP